jgi:hypothetical protein
MPNGVAQGIEDLIEDRFRGGRIAFSDHQNICQTYRLAELRTLPKDVRDPERLSDLPQLPTHARAAIKP